MVVVDQVVEEVVVQLQLLEEQEQLEQQIQVAVQVEHQDIIVQVLIAPEILAVVE